MTGINKNYISPIDETLCQFDQDNAPSQAQIDEVKKYAQINQLRDQINLHIASQEVEWD